MAVDYDGQPSITKVFRFNVVKFDTVDYQHLQILGGEIKATL